MPPTVWSVIVPVRDEAPRLTACLEALSELLRTGPRYEVLVVDDASEDDSLARATRFAARLAGGVSFRVLRAVGTGKKAALVTGIAAARGEWIATLDADVLVPPGWLRGLDRARHPRSVAVAGPVALAPAPTLFGRFQALDFCGMMAITGATLRAGRFVMGNGANLAFAKTAFAAVGGYELSGRAAASGDDMVLLGKLSERFPGGIAFAKTRAAVVRTPPLPTLAAFVRQRWRWSAKTGLNLQPALTATLGLVWAFHTGLLIGVPLALHRRLGWSALAFGWSAKLVVDHRLLREATRFFGREHLLGVDYPVLAIMHAAYVSGVGALSLLPLRFEWKGRRSRY